MDRDARRTRRVPVENVGVVVVIGASVAAQVGDANDKAVRTQDLRIETAHPECCRIEWSRGESRGRRAHGIAQCPYADQRFDFRLARGSGFIQRGNCYRQSAIGLRRYQEVADVAVSAE